MKIHFSIWLLLVSQWRIPVTHADTKSCTIGLIVFCSGELDLLELSNLVDVPSTVQQIHFATGSVFNITNEALTVYPNLDAIFFDATDLKSQDFQSHVFLNVNLTTLSITESMITFDEHFASLLNDLEHLTSLDLTGNPGMTSFHSAGITTFDRLSDFTFTPENIHCDCKLSWFRNYLINRLGRPGRFEISQIVCDSGKKIEESNFCSHSDSNPLVCVNCVSSTNEDCNGFLTNETCVTARHSPTPVCRNEIRINKQNVITIAKGCGTQSGCNSQSNQGTCFGSNPSRCIFCCRGELCNEPETAVLNGYYPDGYPWIPEIITTQVITTTQPTTTMRVTTKMTTLEDTTLKMSSIPHTTIPRATTTDRITFSSTTTTSTTVLPTTEATTTSPVTPKITTASTRATTYITTQLPATTNFSTTRVTKSPSTESPTTLTSTSSNQQTTVIPSTSIIQKATTQPPTTPTLDTTTQPTTNTVRSTSILQTTTVPRTTSKATTFLTSKIMTEEITNPSTPASTIDKITTPKMTTVSAALTKSTESTTVASTTPLTDTSTVSLSTTPTPRQSTKPTTGISTTPTQELSTTSTFGPSTKATTELFTTPTPRPSTKQSTELSTTPNRRLSTKQTTELFTTKTPVQSTTVVTTPPLGKTTEAERSLRTTLTTTSEKDMTTEMLTTTISLLFCSQQEENSDYGEFEWPQTNVGSKFTLQCPFVVSDIPGNATRMCSLEGSIAVWTSTSFSNCRTISESLEKLTEGNITTENVEDVSEELVELTEMSKRLEEEDVENAVEVIEAVSQSLQEIENVSVGVLDNILMTVEQLTNVNESELVEAQMKSGTSQRIIQAVEKTVMSIHIEEDEYNSKSDSLDVSIINLNDNKRQMDVRFPPEEKKDDEEEDDEEEDEIPNTPEDDDTNSDEERSEIALSLTSILIPKEILQNASSVQFILYKDIRLFNSITVAEESVTIPPCSEGLSCLLRPRVLSSFVISASIGNQPIRNLENKVTNTFYHIINGRNQTANNSQCVYWDFQAANGRGDWSTNGCTVFNTTENITTCQCDHLTNFAVLLDIYNNANEINEQHLRIITYISIGGTSLSFISLVLALASYACAGRLRADKRVKVLINLMTALMFMNMAFLFDVIVSEFGNSSKYLCFSAAVIMHYTLMCVMTWMAVEAFTMYLALVRVFDSKAGHFIVKMFLLGWGLPIVIVGLSLIIDQENYGFENNLCYLRRIPFFIFFFVPVCIVLVWNFTVYILVLRQMHHLRKRQTRLNQTFSLSDQLRASFSLTFLLGLTWAFAFFAFGELNLTFTYLFAITNALQGFTIFLFHCLFKKEIRRQWQALCCPWIPLLKEGDYGTYSRSKSGTNPSYGRQSELLSSEPTMNTRSNGTRSRSWFWDERRRSVAESTSTDMTRLSAAISDYTPANTFNRGTMRSETAMTVFSCK